MKRTLCILFLTGLLSAPAIARAPSLVGIVVNTTADSGAGSLRQAILDSNLSTGVVDTITFAIPGVGVHTITPLTPLPFILDPVIVDGSSQPGWTGTPLIEIDGISCTPAVGLSIDSNTTIKGLAITRFTSDGLRVVGANDIIQGCYFGIAPDGATAKGNGGSGASLQGTSTTFGGSLANQGNLASGNTSSGITCSGSATILGNRIGTNAAGTAAVPNTFGVRHSGTFVGITLGGFNAGEGNLISGNTLVGLRTEGGAAATLAYGNLIGTNAAGTAAVPNGEGVRVFSDTAFIGNVFAGAGNVISGNTGAGIVLAGTNTFVRNNIIGRTLGNAGALGNGAEGISNLQGDGSRIEGNVIAHSGTYGVIIQAGSGLRILNNSIHSNGQLGIALGGAGVLGNDPLDTDIGPNDLQNFPVITNAITEGVGNTQVTGYLQSTPNMAFKIQFFDSAAADSSGYGEGEIFRLELSATSDVSGLASFSVVLPASIALGRFITATATDAFNNTSGFSAAVQVTGERTVPTVDITSPAQSTVLTAATPLLLAGTAGDDTGVTGVSWTNSAGGSGPAPLVGSNWTASVALTAGVNLITVTAVDAEGNFATAAVTVTYDPTDPTVAITIPTALATYSSSSTPLSVWGTAADNVSLADIRWSNSAGGSGTALGTDLWAAAIPLTLGSNVITITATDTAGNTATATLTVNYAASGNTGCGLTGVEVLTLLLLVRLRRRR